MNHVVGRMRPVDAEPPLPAGDAGHAESNHARRRHDGDAVDRNLNSVENQGKLSLLTILTWLLMLILDRT